LWCIGALRDRRAPPLLGGTKKLRQHFLALGLEIGGQEAHPSGVVAGRRKGSRQPEADRIVRADDGDGRAGLLPGADRLVPRLENVATGFNQLHCDTGDIGVKWRDFITLDPRKAASGRGPARNSVELARSANRVCVRAATDHVTAAPPILYPTVRTP
jgi:hypothetical protein